ncbi:MAG: putative RNA methyltransferase [Propioniciclava sp.]
MLEAATGLLTCPVCSDPLILAATAARCPVGHSYDVARQGYVNLLGSAPPAHADTAAMVAARDRVLTSGAFTIIETALATQLTAARSLLDVGGGTGHHLARVLDAVPGARGVSLDISVRAARRAARAHPRLASVVADTWSGLPILSAGIDGLLCIFAPRNPAEFARVLAPGGQLLIVTPDPDHLASLRTAYSLLGVEVDKSDRLLRTLADTFTLETRMPLRSALLAEAPLVDDLIAMGPNAFHHTPTDIRAMPTEIAVTLWVFRRRSGSGVTPAAASPVSRK